MQRVEFLSFFLIYIYLAQSVPSSPVRNFNLVSTLDNDIPSVTSTLLPSLEKSIYRRNTPSRRVYLIFQSSSFSATNPPSTVQNPSSNPSIPIIHMNLQLEPGTVPGAWPMTTIQLLKASHPYFDTTSNQVIFKSFYQVWFTQFSARFVTPLSNFPNGRESRIGNSHLMKIYLGKTTATDTDILNPQTGDGVLLQIIRGLPKITSSPGQTRSAFMGRVIDALNIRNRGDLAPGSLPAIVMNRILELSDVNDLRSTYFYGRPVQDVFPDYRIPCIVNYKLVEHAATGIAYSVLDATAPGAAGRLRQIPALPDKTAFWGFLTRFLREPEWNGIYNGREGSNTTSAKR